MISAKDVAIFECPRILWKHCCQKTTFWF